MSVKHTGNHHKPHDGTVAKYTEEPYYRDFGGYWIDGNAVTIDHKITGNGSVNCQVNGIDLEEL